MSQNLRQHQVQQVRPVQPGDLGVEVELLDHVAGVRARTQPCRHSTGRRSWPGPPGPWSGSAARCCRTRLRPPRAATARGRHTGAWTASTLPLRRLQHAVQAPDHRQRQDHLAVLRPPVIPAQQVGHRPDERRVVLYQPPTRRQALPHPSHDPVLSRSSSSTTAGHPPPKHASASVPEASDRSARRPRRITWQGVCHD